MSQRTEVELVKRWRSVVSALKERHGVVLPHFSETAPQGDHFATLKQLEFIRTLPSLLWDHLEGTSFHNDILIHLPVLCYRCSMGRPLLNIEHSKQSNNLFVSVNDRKTFHQLTKLYLCLNEITESLHNIEENNVGRCALNDQVVII